MCIRNKHVAVHSARLVEESSLKTSVDSQPWHWDGETEQEFIRAMFIVGTDSNVEIARQLKSKKTAHNTKGPKLRFLKEHPNWRTKFSHLDPSVVPPSDSEEEEEETETITIEETNDTNIRPAEVVTVEMGTPQKRRVPWRQRPRHRRRSSWIRDPSRGDHHRDGNPCGRVAHRRGGGHRGDRGDIHHINNSSRRTTNHRGGGAYSATCSRRNG